jgi:uncharacterized RDD family membrane protein YckC
VTFPDPYGSGQDAVQPHRSYGQLPPPGFTVAPAVPAGYGYGQYPAVATLGIGYIIWGLIVWGNGQTPALQVLGMRAWRPETNRVAGFWFMALREIAGRIINHVLGIVTLLTSFVLFVSGREHKALHDWIAGTVVLHDPDNVLAS